MKKVIIFHGLSNSCMVAAQHSCMQQLDNWKNKKSEVNEKMYNGTTIHDEEYSTSESIFISYD